MGCVHRGTARRRTGGILGLLRLLDDKEIREAIEYDLLTIGIDLGDLYTSQLTIRRFRVLITGLPGSSRFHAVVRRRLEKEGVQATPIEQLPGDHWSTTDHLVATVADKIEALMWMQADPQSRGSEPNWLPRPGQAARKPKGAKAWFAALGIGDAPTET
ncbi:hypothetical protein DMH04_41295 [Kibdelosporangium aridum]|uniref:Uncharacterized protein n=1 Tax=Kibdelosporangium aridum TaxID=2030 RepID=A0A428YUQ1_KIBAR|nr:hypothetical protein [Kibdelosporangium aridum]RSM73450.1 hypothetical protein DMH04_41295 [Kibdelosporangium aridum]